jgi:hypothetical protein
MDELLPMTQQVSSRSCELASLTNATAVELDDVNSDNMMEATTIMMVTSTDSENFSTFDSPNFETEEHRTRAHPHIVQTMFHSKQKI